MVSSYALQKQACELQQRQLCMPCNLHKSRMGQLHSGVVDTCCAVSLNSPAIILCKALTVTCAALHRTAVQCAWSLGDCTSVHISLTFSSSMLQCLSNAFTRASSLWLFLQLMSTCSGDLCSSLHATPQGAQARPTYTKDSESGTGKSGLYAHGIAEAQPLKRTIELVFTLLVRTDSGPLR